MFVNAIETADQYTRPIHTIARTYGGLVTPGAATFFFVNETGVAITCKHVAEAIVGAESINQSYQRFKMERDALARDATFRRNLKGLELKYKYKPETTIQVKHTFVNCFDAITNIQVQVHPTLDLAIVRFEGFTTKHYHSHAVFVNDPAKIKPGRTLCRLGFPFPEFNNFHYNPVTDDIEWTTTGNQLSPRFPIDGMITRFAGDPANPGAVLSIELSTPGLRGQSGGPLFDRDGLVYGMQYVTHHLHLGFDITDLGIVSDGKKGKVSNSPFLHVGHCIHVNQIKAFLQEHGVRYYEA
ncbi:MAG: serine protease [Cytophagaceae bacterium]|nr:serine protease [Cytophagaceae bacterium]